MIHIKQSGILEQAASFLMTSSNERRASERWYVVMTQPSREHYAAANLANQGFQSFFPRQVATISHARRLRTGLTPVFPQYLFVMLDPGVNRWRAINGTYGVRKVIDDGKRPLAVRPGVVETLLESCDSRGVLVFRESPLKPGDRVRLISGPFAGAMGSLQSLDASGRVRLLLDFMTGKIPAIADTSSICLEP